MKRILLLLSIVLLSSCTKDDADCKCDAIYRKVNWNNGQSFEFTVTGQPVDCETKQPTKAYSDKDAFFIRCR